MKQETKERAIFLDFQLGWSERFPGGRVVEMGQIQKSTMETRFVGLCKWRMVARRPGTAIVGWSPTEKSDGCSARLFGKLRPSESGY